MCEGPQSWCSSRTTLNLDTDTQRQSWSPTSFFSRICTPISFSSRWILSCLYAMTEGLFSCLLTLRDEPWALNGNKPGPAMSDGGDDCLFLTLWGAVTNFSASAEGKRRPRCRRLNTFVFFIGVMYSVSSVREDCWPHWIDRCIYVCIILHTKGGQTPFHPNINHRSYVLLQLIRNCTHDHVNSSSMILPM